MTRFWIAQALRQVGQAITEEAAPKRITTDKLARPFGGNAYRPFMIKVSGQTIGQRILISLSEGEK